MPSAAISCDVLVLGAGLAGLRAAWAAREAWPRADVLVVAPRRGPSGSSFANRNNALGMQAPAEHEAQAFVDEALRLAPPGRVDATLVRAMAADAEARLAELLSLGLAFRRHADGSLRRFPGCFSPIPRAVVFDGLASAHAAFVARVQGLGARLLHGWEAVDIALNADGRAAGAWLRPLRGGGSGGDALAVRAGAVVAAMGGPGPLFARRMCGPGGSGLAYGLLRRAGAELVNARWLQFFWLRAGDGAFVNPGDLPWPGRLTLLAASRRAHCPVSWELPDAALDFELMARRDGRGLAPLPEGGAVALFAHAGNGGARIDAQGRTGVPGLYACGECAGGMHGANRLGGGMVLAALTFGARAGAAAAQEASSRAQTAAQLCPPAPGALLALEPSFLRRLRRSMDAHARPGASPAPGFVAWLARQADEARPLKQRLLALSALSVVGEI